jgi:hypothetical protein
VQAWLQTKDFVLLLLLPLLLLFLCLQALYWWGRLGRSKMKEDGANEEDWVSGVADLVGIGEQGLGFTMSGFRVY